ncbi:hypothetical protein ACA910_007198 [Epithemia clementina (nom. ined.)]
MDNDDDDVLDISEQTNRPTDDALHQQRVEAWQPILDPVWVIVSLFYLGVILVPTGLKLTSMQDDVTELKLVYDKVDNPNPACGIGENFNAGKVCEISFTAPVDMSPPVLVYYELTNFHQNHRSYVSSRDDSQLFGYVGTQDRVSQERCEPLNRLGNITLNPCGLIANTFFNDIFVLTSGVDANNVPLTMLETGIAWQSDLEYVFAQPDGFRSEVCPSSVGCTPECCAGDNWTCRNDEPYVDPQTGICYRYFYPNDNHTQYLYETYPDIISPLEGVTNEHFVVWMRVALQPTFRKLYGWIDQPIAKGSVLKFNITSNYVVTRFRGSKALVVSTNTIFGGRNMYLGPSFTWVGVFCLGVGFFFSVKQIFRPRKLADRSYLHFKTD